MYSIRVNSPQFTTIFLHLDKGENYPIDLTNPTANPIHLTWEREVHDQFWLLILEAVRLQGITSIITIGIGNNGAVIDFTPNTINLSLGGKRNFGLGTIRSKRIIYPRGNNKQQVD